MPHDLILGTALLKDELIIMMYKHSRGFERAEEFKYLGTTLTKQNSTPEEIRAD